MRRVTRRGAVLVLLAVVALLGTTAVALAASQQFGYHKVRKGLPNGLPRMTVTSTDLKAGKPIPPQFWGCTSAGSPLSCPGRECLQGRKASW